MNEYILGYHVTFEDSILKLILRESHHTCTARPGYAVDQTIYPFSVGILASKLGHKRPHDIQVFMMCIYTYIYTHTMKKKMLV